MFCIFSIYFHLLLLYVTFYSFCNVHYYWVGIWRGKKITFFDHCKPTTRPEIWWGQSKPSQYRDTHNTETHTDWQKHTNWHTDAQWHRHKHKSLINNHNVLCTSNDLWWKSLWSVWRHNLPTVPLYNPLCSKWLYCPRGQLAKPNQQIWKSLVVPRHCDAAAVGRGSFLLGKLKSGKQNPIKDIHSLEVVHLPTSRTQQANLFKCSVVAQAVQAPTVWIQYQEQRGWGERRFLWEIPLLQTKVQLRSLTDLEIRTIVVLLGSPIRLVFVCRFQDFDTVNKLWNTSISLVEKLTSEILVVSCTVRHYTFFCTFRHHTFPDVPPGAGPAHWMNTQGLGWNFRPHRLSHFSSSICFMT